MFDMLHYAYAHLEECKLILCCSEGTRFSGLIDEMVEIEVDAIPGVRFEGRVASISEATGASFALIPQDNSAGNFVKVEQRIPVRIEFTGTNRPEDMNRLRAGMNVECKVNY